MYSIDQGKLLVKSARKMIELVVATNRPLSDPAPSKELEKKAGAFVTLKASDNKLRGCMGYTTLTLSVWNAVLSSAFNAAFRDPRFTPLSATELNEVTIEVTILSEPIQLEGNHKDFPSKIKIGKHGIIVEKGKDIGVFLSDVAIEQEWDSEEFLNQVCIKARLLRNAWQEKRTKVYVFESQIFKEVDPKGEIEEIKN